MTLAIRFIPNAGRTVIYAASGRTYRRTGAAAWIDVPIPDAETIDPDQAMRLMVIGATADRPVNVPGRINWPPAVMYDATLGNPIFLVPGSNPARWVSISGMPV
jgi:hypothetical protein